MITLSPAAATQIRAAAEQAGAQGEALRLAARRLGEGPVEYVMGFDDVREGDLECSIEGIRVLISPDGRGLLEGVLLDFVTLDTGDRQFIFVAPGQRRAIEAGGE